jgi:hypothetical protein
MPSFIVKMLPQKYYSNVSCSFKRQVSIDAHYFEVIVAEFKLVFESKQESVNLNTRTG